MKMALRMSAVVPIVTLLILVCLLIYSSNFVRMMMRLRKTRENFDSYLNETYIDRKFAKSLPEKTEYKTPLRNSNLKVNNGRTEIHLVFLVSAHPPSVSRTLPPYLQANRTTFEPRRKSNLDVRLNYTPVHLIFWAYVDVDHPMVKIRRRRFMRRIWIINWILVLFTFIFVVLLACLLFTYIC